jgi:hypothetical protein
MARGVRRQVLAVAGIALAVPALMLIPSAAGTALAASPPPKPVTAADGNWVVHNAENSWIGHGNNRWIGHGNNRWIAHTTQWPSGIAHGNNRGIAHSDDRGIGLGNN